MKTTKEERAHWKPLFRGFDAGGAPEFTHRLIDDVDDAARLLERAGGALEYGGACTCIEADIDEPIPPCPRCELQPLVATFLKEPKQ